MSSGWFPIVWVLAASSSDVDGAQARWATEWGAHDGGPEILRAGQCPTDIPSFAQSEDGSWPWVPRGALCDVPVVHLSYRYCAGCGDDSATGTPLRVGAWRPFRVIGDVERWPEWTLHLFSGARRWDVPGLDVAGAIEGPEAPVGGAASAPLLVGVVRALQPGASGWVGLRPSTRTDAISGLDEAASSHLLDRLGLPGEGAALRAWFSPGSEPGGADAPRDQTLSGRSLFTALVEVNDWIAEGLGPSYELIVYRSLRSQLDHAGRERLLERHLPAGLRAAAPALADQVVGVYGVAIVGTYRVSETLFVWVPAGVPGGPEREQAMFSLIQAVPDSDVVQRVTRARLVASMSCLAYAGGLGRDRPAGCPELLP